MKSDKKVAGGGATMSPDVSCQEIKLENIPPNGLEIKHRTEPQFCTSHVTSSHYQWTRESLGWEIIGKLFKQKLVA